MPRLCGRRLSQRLALGGGAVGHDGADLGGRGEQLRGLGADDVEIVFFAGVDVVGGHQLQDLALGDHRRGLGQDRQHVERRVGDHQLERAREQEVAHQDRRLVAPKRVGRRGAAAQTALVDHVVVQQRRGMDQLDARGEPDMAFALVTAHPRGGEGDHRAEPLAAGGDDVAGELGHQQHRALHAVDDRAVDRFHVGSGQRRQPFQGRNPARLGFPRKLDDDAHLLCPPRH